MKSESDISHRLNKLRMRYLSKFVKESQTRKSCNCKFNIIHQPKRTLRSPEEDLSISPRRTNSLVVLQSLRDPIGICSYGSEDPATWNGDVVCDKSIDLAPNCPYFQSKVDRDDAISEFNSRLNDDQYVLENYPDIAALQWVLNIRIAANRLSWFNRVIIKICHFLKPKEVKLLPAGSDSIDDVSMENIWK